VLIGFHETRSAALSLIEYFDVFDISLASFSVNLNIYVQLFSYFASVPILFAVLCRSLSIVLLLVLI
jgi:hypothetical protein